MTPGHSLLSSHFISLFFPPSLFHVAFYFHSLCFSSPSFFFSLSPLPLSPSSCLYSLLMPPHSLLSPPPLSLPSLLLPSLPTSPLSTVARLAAEYARSGSSLSADYGSWQIVSGCGSIHDRGQFLPIPTATNDFPLPFIFQDEGPSGRM